MEFPGLDDCNNVARVPDALAERDKLNPCQVHRLCKLAFLAPDIMERIIAGQIPDTLSLETLKRDFPVAWDASLIGACRQPCGSARGPAQSG